MAQWTNWINSIRFYIHPLIMDLIYQVFLEPPADFSSTMEAAGCYCSCKDTLLLVQRQPFKIQGDRWGVPAGKLEEAEDPLSAVVREMGEEVGIHLMHEQLHEIATLYVRLPTRDYTFHMFHTRLLHFPEIILDLSENKEARWTTFTEALALPLVAAGKEALLYYKSYLSKNEGKREDFDYLLQKKNEIN